MVEPTLVVLAAGMGSRYGGVKQIDSVGLHDEILEREFLIELQETLRQSMFFNQLKIF